MALLKIEPHEKVQAAIIDLQYRKVADGRGGYREVGNPFFAYLAMMLRPKVMTADKTMRTMCVNGKGELEFDLDFVDKLTSEEVMGVICHEVLHVALLHMLRREDRQPVIANIAQDMAVNCLVRQEDIVLPKIGIQYSRQDDMCSVVVGQQKVEVWNISKKSWETIYAEIHPQLKDNPKTQPQQSNNGAYGGFDEHEKGEGTSEEMSEESDKWQRALAEAATYAKQQGKFSAGVSRIIDEVLKPKVNWAQVLMQYLQPYLMPTDLSYQKPHKKSQALGVYMPMVTKEHMDIEVLVDTSGSITADELRKFVTEIVGIQDAFPSVNMSISFADTKIKSRYAVRDIRSEVDSLEAKGGGGTSMESALDEIADLNREASVVVVLTDGEDSYQRRGNEYPFDVVWALSENGKSLEAFERGPQYGERFKLTN